MTGGYVYARHLIENLQATGWRVEVLSLPVGFPRPTDEEIHQTRRLFEALPPGSLVLVDGLAFGATPRVVFDGLQLNFVALVHHPLALETGLTDAERQRLKESERVALNAACRVIVTSPFTADTLVESYGVPRSKLDVALPGTDQKQRAERNKSPPQLLTVATVTHRKGYDVLVGALAQLADLAWTAISIGSLAREPDTVAKLKIFAQNSHIAARIEFRGEVSAETLEAEYNRASIFVLPSRYEGYGMAFAEALAHGLPVVACASGAVPLTVPKNASLLVPADNVEALSLALRRLLCDSNLRDSLSNAAWEHAQGLPSWANTGTSVATALSAVTR